MYAKAAFVVASLGSLSSVAIASPPAPEPARVVREVAPRQTGSDLLGQLLDLANQFDLSACIPGALPLVTGLPPIPSGFLEGDLVDQILSQTTLGVTGVCDFTVTGDAGSTFTSFLPTLLSWYDENKSTISEIATPCPSAASFLTTVNAYETCPQAVAQTTAPADEGTTGSMTILPEPTTPSLTDTVISIPTDTTLSLSDTVISEPTSAPTDITSTNVDDSPASSTSTPAQAAAARETALAAAVLAAAGFVGAIAVL